MIFPALPGVKRNIERTPNKPVIRSNFEGNYAQTRPRFTRASYEFKIEYPVLTLDQLQTLEAFFIAYSGVSFLWTNPDDGIERTVRFVDDKLPSRQIDKKQYTVSFALEEV